MPGVHFNVLGLNSSEIRFNNLEIRSAHVSRLRPNIDDTNHFHLDLTGISQLIYAMEAHSTFN